MFRSTAQIWRWSIAIKGHHQFTRPSDVIIDASMPAMIRTSGQMWDKNSDVQDTKAIIPDSSYSGIYNATIDFCKNTVHLILQQWVQCPM